MKTIEYMTPETKVIKLSINKHLLEASGSTAGGGGSYDPSTGDPNE